MNSGIAKSSFRGETRPINDKPYADSHMLVLDGAHNPAKMKAFLSALKSLFPKQKKVFLVAFKSNKDAGKMLSEIVKAADVIIATRFTVSMGYVSSGAMEPTNIKNQISKIKNNQKVVVEESSRKALSMALELAKKDELIVFTGSLYLVGEVRSML